VSKPAEPGGCKVGIDLLDLGVSLMTIRAKLTPNATLFIASPGDFVEGGVIRVDPGDSCAQLADDSAGSGAVTGEDRRSQPVNRIVSPG
jgi:hypothetical protein